MSEKSQGFLGLLVKIALWILGFFAVFGVVGMIVIIIRDTNKPPPNPFKAMEELVSSYQPENGRFMVFVARNNNVIFAHGDGDDTETDTLFPINGISDTLIAMGIGVLVDQDRLRFEQTLGELLSDVPEPVRGISLHHLIYHTSGLQVDMPSEGDFDWVEAEPGTVSRYSALDFHLLEQVLTANIDQPLSSFMQEAVFDKVTFDKASMKHARVSQEDGKWLWQASAEDLFAWDMALSTNILARFEKVMFKLFKAKRLENGELGSFAGGWFVGDYRGLRLEVAAGFDGQINGVMARFPERRFVCVILSEQPPEMFNARGLVREIAEIYLGREMPRPASERDQDGTGI